MIGSLVSRGILLSLFLIAFALEGVAQGAAPKDEWERLYSAAKDILRPQALDVDRVWDNEDVDLFQCDSLDSYSAPKAYVVEKPSRLDTRRALMFQLAFQVTVLEETLKSVGYDPDYWRDAIQKEEKSAYRRIRYALFPVYDWSINIDFAVVSKSVNRDPKVKNGSLPKTVALGECGAGEFPVLFNTLGGKDVLIINDFEYKLCNKLQIDAEDTKHCSGWLIAAADVEYMAAGIYRYKFDENSTSSKRINIDAIGKTDTSGRTLVRLR
jgi:hypothetical protein